jgi:2-polyprenyl-6-methoxyphenol hydroxylase-like FAD-dependent oxidoreductase
MLNGLRRFMQTRYYMLNKKIVILGGGIGGLTIAIALKIRGFNKVQIYERGDVANNLGAGLVLWANAMGILQKLGLENEIGKVGGELRKMIRISKEGESLGEISIDVIDEKIGYSSHPISRKKLIEILEKEALDLGVKINYLMNVEEIVQLEDAHVRVQFSDGKFVEAGIVIGADGRMNSVARKFVVGENRPVYQHYVNWVGLIENTALEINKTQNVYDYWGVGERFGYVPINETSSYWAGCKKLKGGLGLPEDGNKNYLLEIFQHWPSPINEVISKTSDENIKRIEVYDLNPIQNWYRGNVCLLGDSAHAALPTSGQGACQAIEDAWHLSLLLSESNVELRDAFEKYQNIREKKANAILMGARGFAESLFNEDQDYCTIRNQRAKESNSEVQASGMANLWTEGIP